MTFDQWWKKFSGNDVCDNYEETKSAWEAGYEEGKEQMLHGIEKMTKIIKDRSGDYPLQ